MKKIEALMHFSHSESIGKLYRNRKEQIAAAKRMADFFGDCSHIAVLSWNAVVPRGRAYELAFRTNGAIELRPEDYK